MQDSLYLNFLAKSEEMNLTFPEFFLDDNDEFDLDKGLDHLMFLGLLTIDHEKDAILYGEELKAEFPAVFEVLKMIHTQEVQDGLNALVQLGYVVEYFDPETQEMVYQVTEEGKAYLGEM